MIEVFDEDDVKECLAEVKDSKIKTYAFCLLDWAVQKRKVKAIPIDQVKQAREEIDNCLAEYILGWNGDNPLVSKQGVFEILDKLIAESEVIYK